MTRQFRLILMCILAGLLTLSICSLKSDVAYAQSAGPFKIYAANGGVYLVGTQGTVMFCSGDTYATGSGAAVQIQPTGICIVLASALLTPTTDQWVGTPVANTAAMFFLDSTNGHLFECATFDSSVSGIVGPPTNYLSGKCQNFGFVTP